jgi:LDH2 family malate/lactate/ureidoglycolate dehydrogenase
MRRESSEYLQAVYEAIWTRLGAPPEEARIYARCFVRADLAGKETQGIACIPLVYPWIRRGGIEFGRPIKVVKEDAGFALVDGQRGPGQVVCTRAMELAIEKARTATVASVWVRNSNDFTMASNYSTMALEHDYFGLAMSNGVPLVAPWGGRDPVFNTSPMSFAVPAGAEKPIVFDGAMSAVYHGHVVLAARQRRLMPESPLVDDDGRITNDPVPLIVDPFDRNSPQRGAIRTLGAKGFAWVLLVEVLSGIMSGGASAPEIPFDQSAEMPWTGGMFLMAINVGNLVDLEAFKIKVDGIIRNCKASRLADGFKEIVLPGERAQREADRRARDGVPIRDEDWANIVGIAGELGVDLDALRSRVN